ncbi:MAG: hypothetical protein ACO2OQ_01935, partial [Thermofilaceae archaeon]
GSPERQVRDGLPPAQEELQDQHLATETCAVGVAAFRSLNRRVRILNVPGRVEETARRMRAPSIAGSAHISMACNEASSPRNFKMEVSCHPNRVYAL